MDAEPVFYSAFWTSLNTGVVSLCRDWEGAGLPDLRWGSKELPLRDLEPAPLSDYGNLSGYFVKDETLYFVVRGDRHKQVNLKKDRLFVTGEFNGWEAAAGDRSWELKPMELDGTAYYGLAVEADRLDWRQAHLFKFVTGKKIWLDVPAGAPNVHTDEAHNRNFQIRPERTGRHRFRFRTPLPLNRSAEAILVYLEGDRRETVQLQAGVFLKRLEAKGPLGAIVEEDCTVFRLFAPRAAQVRLHLFEDLEHDRPRPILLKLGGDLVWEVRVPGVHAGWFYYFTVVGNGQEGFGHFDETFRILDPYALACVGPLGPGIVVDQGTLPRPTARFTPPHWHDLVIVEAHLRDLLQHAPIELAADERRGYAGLRKWVRERSCYLRELGVNAVELQPIHEFDTVDPAEYGWGYMPVNYFAPASQYARDPHNATQIGEFRAVVEAFHEAGLAVILDVVYNHVGNPNHLQYIDKEYYFMLDDDGEYLNFSGCGNTIDPDTPMSRRLMRDSLVHFLETFDVDGFRFDLGELLGIECLGYLEAEVKKVKPSAFLVAEPWSFRGHIADRFKEIGMAFWNDGYRDFLRDYLAGEASADALKHYMQGCRDELTAFPAQTVNYVSSHDDRVWIDKITENEECDGSFPTLRDRRRTHLMGAVLLLSVGVPMLHAGVDFLYSKGGRNNTYLDGEANALPYGRQRFFAGTHEYFRRLIAFRQSAPGRLVRLNGHPERGFFRTAADDRALAMLYNAHRERGPEQLLFAINPTAETRRLQFSGIEWADWLQVADHERVEAGGLASARFVSDGETVELPGLSCGIWIRR